MAMPGQYMHLYISTRSYELQYWSHNHIFHNFAGLIGLIADRKQMFLSSSEEHFLAPIYWFEIVSFNSGLQGSSQG